MVIWFAWLRTCSHERFHIINNRIYCGSFIRALCLNSNLGGFMNNYRWYIEASTDNSNNLAWPSYAIVDSEGYTVLGMTKIHKSDVEHIVSMHNSSIKEHI